MIEVRERLTDRLNRARLKLELRRAARPLLVIAVGIGAALACAFYLIENIAKTVYTPTHQLAFEVSNASGVVGGGRQELEFKGIPAGVIDDVRLLDGRPVIDASLYTQFGRIFRNATVTLRPATALQDMYLDILSRGTAHAGVVSAADPLPLSQTTTSVQPADALDVFQPDVRAQLATLLDQLGNGLQDRGTALQQAFVRVMPFLQLTNRLSRQLALRTGLTRTLIHNVGTLTAELAQRQNDLRTLVESSGTTLRALQTSAPNLNATLAELPATLDAINSSFAAVRATLPDLDPALTNLDHVAGRLNGGLAALRNLSTAARPALRALQPPVRQLVPLSIDLKPVAEDLQQAVTLLARQVSAIDHVTRTVDGCATALQGFFQWTPSVTKFWGPDGPGVRGDVAVGLNSTGLVKDPSVSPSPSCAPGGPSGATPGPGGS